METRDRQGTTSLDVVPAAGFVGGLRRRARETALRILYPPLVLREYLQPTVQPHLRIVLYHFVFDGERSRFEEHLRFFKDHYSILPLGDALNRLRNGGLTGPSLAITFDDGYKNNRTNAAELLSKHGLSACFYITAEFISLAAVEQQAVANMCRRNFQLTSPVQNMDWDDVRWLSRAGHEIGSHTMTHAILTSCSTQDAYWEIVGSKAIIEQHLGERIRHFGVPFGLRQHYSLGLSRMVREAGYESCVLTIGGTNLPGCDIHLLRRDALAACWSLREVRTQLLRSVCWTPPLFAEPS